MALNNVLHQLKIDETRKKFDYFDYWCDWLSLSYEKPIDYLENILFWVDYDNSNFWTVDFNWYEFTYIKSRVEIWSSLKFVYVYNWVAIPIMQYVKFNSHTRQISRKNCKISVYWSYYRLEQIWEFYSWFIHWFIKWFSLEDPRILRYDMRFDYFSESKLIDVPTINDVCWYLHTQSTTIEWKEWNKLIDWSIWNWETWRYKVRYYDKKIDTDKKNKWVLYSDFMKYKSVHRLEIEFLRQFTRVYTLSNIWALEDKIMWCLNLKDNNWSIATGMFYKYDSSKEINSENYWRFFDRYLSATRKLLKAWYNPYKLIEEAIVWEYWRDKAIWLIEDFINQSLSYERN